MYGHTYIKSMDQPGKVTNPARGQLNRTGETNISLSAFALENMASRDGFSRVNLLISVLRLNLVLTYGILPEFRKGVYLFI